MISYSRIIKSRYLSNNVQRVRLLPSDDLLPFMT